MKYLATFDPNGLDLAKWCDTIKEAEEWLDSRNNNAEYTTVIDWYDDNNNLVDGIMHTIG